MPKDHSKSGTYTAPPITGHLPLATQLRHIICGPETGFLMEAHNALSARIAENAGFKALWASSLTISASMGLRDANELTWTQSLDLISGMIDAVGIPILMDADSGYGDFNIFSRFVRKAGERGVAGVCIEDKLFPKINSFAKTEQHLASVNDFCAKIRAAKDNQIHPDFMLVARTEALVVGADLEETLVRAEAYYEAGADAILVHSKSNTAHEILAFADKWSNKAPIVVVPTTYADTPTDTLTNAGVSTLIWANHSLRAAIRSMEDITARIFKQQSLNGIDADVTSIEDVFSLTDMSELIAATKRYQGHS
ncbi:phosphoenolpyruvate mutase [Kordiimonas aquimaris]|uniref:phosphoenolpyruvate mutase n=1 Tax=Kordiimonas aquimaris TaxID=707591 RepID=UPI0021CE54D4|nr:phosphoenolpyruvate mutase [Kordiimonas aquimaris]